MTGKILPASEIDAAIAEEQLRDAATRPANSPELLDIRDRSMAQARAQGSHCPQGLVQRSIGYPENVRSGFFREACSGFPRSLR